MGDSTNKLLLVCLEEILHEPERLLATARGSYRHQLGFLKLVLRSDDNGSVLRLHLWDNSATILEDVHSHCADFTSRVVSGGLEERQYDLVPGRNFSRFRYHFDECTGHALAHADGLTDVIQTGMKRLLAGDVYRRRSHELHTVATTSVDTMTVSMWSQRAAEAIVIKPIDARSEDCGAKAGISLEYAKNLLVSIFERINADT